MLLKILKKCVDVSRTFLKIKELHTTEPNNTVLLKNSRILLIKNIIRDSENRIFLIGLIYLTSDDYFTDPIESRCIDTFLVRNEYLSAESSCHPMESLRHKCMKLPAFLDDNNESWVISPMTMNIG